MLSVMAHLVGLGQWFRFRFRFRVQGLRLSAMAHLRGSKGEGGRGEGSRDSIDHFCG
jgi:hypothetical protein